MGYCAAGSIVRVNRPSPLLDLAVPLRGLHIWSTYVVIYVDPSLVRDIRCRMRGEELRAGIIAATRGIP